MKKNFLLTLTLVALSLIACLGASAQKPKMVLLEEFMQASCDPCLNAAPNLDSVLTNNMNNCIPIRFHVDWPGTDYMDDETDASFVTPRVNFYSINGVPDARMDGVFDQDPSAINSDTIQHEKAKTSPFTITITSCTYNTTTNTYALAASIKAYAAVSSTHLVAQTVLTIDTIKYAQDQSTEDPPSYFGPSGYYPLSWYQYVLNFPQVAEDMLPTSNGTTLTAFTSGQTQNISVSWKKNHPWGSSPKTYKYDSVGAHMVVFVQDNSTQYVYQANMAVPSVITGVDEVSATAGPIEIYPNPSNGLTHIMYNLDNDRNTTIEVWNMVGQKVMDVNNGMQSAGRHEVLINKGNLQPGMYFIRLVTDDGVTVQKLEIQ
ncbi:MAG TPA: T9SS type A sorting domain-containing protein [Bacteroidia bacterium]|jgi:hypothetical protein|nr:T9SS type A sorting domain-containing protein [Bacteroidia bacterium]